MQSYSYNTAGVCSKRIDFNVDDAGKLHDVKFYGGCPGNLLAIGKLIEGKDAKEIAEVLRGNDCRGRGTSCADQLALAIDSLFESNEFVNGSLLR